jgi:hypothetical protein
MRNIIFLTAALVLCSLAFFTAPRAASSASLHDVSVLNGKWISKSGDEMTLEFNDGKGKFKNDVYDADFVCVWNAEDGTFVFNPPKDDAPYIYGVITMQRDGKDAWFKLTGSYGDGVPTGFDADMYRANG